MAYGQSLGWLTNTSPVRQADRVGQAYPEAQRVTAAWFRILPSVVLAFVIQERFMSFAFHGNLIPRYLDTSNARGIIWGCFTSRRRISFHGTPHGS